MQRFTISLDDGLAAEFDGLIARRGYVHRSEAVRDLIREKLGAEHLDAQGAQWCAATVSYVYDQHDQAASARVRALQHDHHDLVVTTVSTQLDHDHCLETAVLRGPAPAVLECAQQLVAARGVRHGSIHAIPLAEDRQAHRHDAPASHRHTHLRPLN